ncbi:hypothetical protein LMK54_003247 [Salmonella enterica]|nr:hypothetical protein [Salmonella enterica]
MKILFIGESWHIHMIHSKGFDSFTSSKYEEGADYLLSCLRRVMSMWTTCLPILCKLVFHKPPKH